MDPAASAALISARKSFPLFYATTRPEDILKMDALVLAHAALVVGLNTPRKGESLEDREELERLTDVSEALFTELRSSVRRCTTFAAVPCDERAQIVRLLFEVKPPLFS